MRLATRKLSEYKYLTFNNTLTSGISKSDASKNIVDPASYVQYGDPLTHMYVSHFNVNALLKAISADAALGFGEKVATFPLGRIKPLGASIELTTSCPTGLSATAGEVALGSVIATGAIATMGAGANTMEDFMEGTTIANNVAATPLASYKTNLPSIAAGTTATDGVRILDGSATVTPLHLNICSTWDQTAAESVTFSAKIRLVWQWMGTGVAS